MTMGSFVRSRSGTVLGVVGLMVGLLVGTSVGPASAAPAVKQAAAWTPAAEPLPANAGLNPTSSLDAEACPASGSCVAVGDYYDGNGDQQGLVDTQSDGAWTSLQAPLPVNAGTDPQALLFAITCPSTGTCVAVGWYDDANGDQHGLIETWAGGAWTSEEAPLPADAFASPDAGLDAVSCPATGSCVAAGAFAATGDDEQPLIETLATGSWTALQAPLPTNSLATEGFSFPEFNAVSCPAVASCVAVGQYTDTGDNPEGLIETWSGAAWTPTEAPLSAGGSSPSLNAVSCPAPGQCLAIGAYADSGNDQQGLIETLSGGSWAPTDAPLPAGGSESSLDDVTCPTAGSCVVVGGYLDAGESFHGLIEVLSGSSWSPVEAPLPSNATVSVDAEPQLSAVSCMAAGSCVAVGDYTDTNDDDQGLIETLSAGTWTALESTVPANGSAGPGAGLGSVTCLAASCVATGVYGQQQQGLIDVLSGGTWSATEGPYPANSLVIPYDSADSVACPAAGSCVALGAYDDSTGASRELIETLANGAWSPTEASLPANAASSRRFSPDAKTCRTGHPCAGAVPAGIPGCCRGVGVSSASAAGPPAPAVTCPAVGSCVAVGSYVDASGDTEGFIESLSKGTWTSTEAPVPANADGNPGVELGDVTCPVVGSCVALGGYDDTDGDAQPLLETLSGGTWTATAAPVPAGAQGDVSLDAVSCGAAGTCVAVGDYEGAGDNEQALIETLSGGVWTATNAPLPTNSASGDFFFAGLQDVSCPATTACVALGSYLDSSFNQDGLLETLSGGVWTAIAAPLPTGAEGFTYLDALSCAGEGACVASGSYEASNGDVAGLLETLSTGGWTPAEAPLPGNAPTTASVYLDAVSCAAANTCVAVGEYSDVDGTGPGAGLIETLSGGIWTPTAAPVPAVPVATTAIGLGAVSCPATSFCVALGRYSGTPYGQQGFIETLSSGKIGPTITSAAQATFAVGETGTFSVTATGNPVPSLAEKGKLPNGVTFKRSKGAATISGTPRAKDVAGDFPITITASNGVLPKSTQSFTLVLTP
jgi:hypothetical protein